MGVTVNITDTDEQDVTITAADPFAFDEGGSLTYTVVLDTEPTGTVTVSVDDTDTTDEIRVDKTALEFTTGNWDVPQTVRVSADRDADAADDTGTIEHGVTGADYGTENPTVDSVEVTVRDLSVKSVTVDTDSERAGVQTELTIGEGFSGAYEVVLGTEPVGGTVTISISSDNTDVTVDPTPLEFNADNWNEPQEVTVLAGHDDADTAEDTATLTHAISGADYGGVTAEAVTVTVNDDDGPSFSTSADSLTVLERSDEAPTLSSSYTVVLDTIPVGGDVTITITVGGNSDIKLQDPNDNTNHVEELALEFATTTWDQPQTVTVLALNDPDALDETGALNHVATGANFAGRAPDVTMAVRIDDTTLAAVGIDPTMLSMTEGRTATYGVVLQSQPQSNVVIVVSSSDTGAVSTSPGRLTFTPSTWDEEQKVTLTAVSDSDGDNESVIVSHSSSGSSDITYADLTNIDSVSVNVVEDGTARSDTSSFLQSSSCDGDVNLTWNSPTTNEAAIASYRIEWRTADQQYDSSRRVTATAEASGYTLGSLKNGVQYTIRVVAFDAEQNALWSRETTSTPTAASCIATVRFGNVLWDSAPVIVEVEDAKLGTQVNLRHRSLNPGVWSEPQSKHLEAGETQVAFDIYGLVPGNAYEVQAWLGASQTPPSTDDETASVAQTIFSTPVAPEGVSIRAGFGGGGSIARILRIEPSIETVSLSTGDEVVLSVEVWGRQELHDNDLADRHPEDGRPEFVWSSDGGGNFREGQLRSDWSDREANDRDVVFIAPIVGGRFTVKASLVDSSHCLPVQEDESSEEHLARCTAQINVTVKNRSAFEPFKTVPVNPPGTIPETLTDSDGVAYAVFTPVDGGSYQGDGYSLTAGPGAVPNYEIIGVAMMPVGPATNAGETWHRYTLGGLKYWVGVVNSAGEIISDYSLRDVVTACVPLPTELRANISDVILLSTHGEGGLTVLGTSVRLTSDGPAVCGKLSSLPATVAVGKSGSPPELPDEALEAVEGLPDTGGSQLGVHLLVSLLLIGIIGAIVGRRMVCRLRRSLLRNANEWG